MARSIAAALVLATALIAVPSAGAAQLETVGTFSNPVSIAAPPGDPDRVFVVEQHGTIQELIDGVKQAQPFLDISSMVDTAGDEEGLLSMAFAPDYATSHHFFVYYTATAPTVPTTGDIEVDEFTTTSPDHVDVTSRARVLTIPHHIQENHNGGQLQFGPDGMLYLGTGDGGGGGDTQGNGQNLTASDPAANQSPLLAKILRIEPVPGNVAAPGNPFMSDPDVWMLGLRNPWRFSFDRTTGDMIIGDVGQDLYEEIDYVPAAGPGLPGGAGENFGWNIREGLHAFSMSETQATPTLSDPVIEEPHTDGWAAIIGGYVVRDPGLPELDGTYLFGDNAKGELFGATMSAPGGVPTATNVRDLGLAVPELAGMGEDACGRVYMALLGGTVQRLVNDSGGYTCTTAAVMPPFPGAPGAPGAPGTPGTPTTPGVPPPAADQTPPKLHLTFSIHQHVLVLARVLLHVGCDEHCTLTASGKLHIGSHVRSVAAKKVVLAAGAVVTLKLALSRPLRSLIHSALRRHRHPRVAVTLRAVDQAGNVKQRRFNVAITG
jgi:glucose/arabinose dehydrogenase